jgi:hypothetical protein
MTCNAPGELDEKTVRVPSSFILPSSTHTLTQAPNFADGVGEISKAVDLPDSVWEIWLYGRGVTTANIARASKSPNDV